MREPKEAQQVQRLVAGRTGAGHGTQLVGLE